MNKIVNDTIKIAINKFYDKLMEEYSYNNILGVFTVGPANYGFAESAEEIQLIAIYIPSFEELCGTKTRLEIDIPSYCSIIDIRKIYTATTNNDRSLELLFSKYYKINPIFKTIFNDTFTKDRELISHFCDKIRMEKAYIYAEAAFDEGNYFEAYRLYIAAYLFLHEEKTEDCFFITDDFYVDYLWSIKHGAVIPDKEKTLNSIKKLVDMASDEQHLDADALIKKHIVELIRFSLVDKIESDAFTHYLTSTENEALNFLLSKLDNGVGFISISKIVEESRISRPVFKNLLLKMDTKNVAEVTSHGAQGTYIKILDKKLLV